MIGFFFETSGWIFLAWIMISLCMIVQAFFWRYIIEKIYTRNKYSILFFLRFLFLISVLIAFPFFVPHGLAIKYSYVNRAKDVLSRANLATLPESAYNVNVYTPRGPFSPAYDYLRFQAEPNDIEKFFADSLGLDGIKNDTNSSYYFDRPSWFNPNTLLAARHYKLSEEDTSWRGKLIIDDENHIVYIYNYRD
jgi:hypothetical protein